jgi:hypothetical protein
VHSNLTNANHIIFMSPYITDRDQTYHAAMTQAKGRARRYGQTRPVHIYHFLSLKTVDVDEMQQRTRLTLTEAAEQPEFVPYEGFESSPLSLLPGKQGVVGKYGSAVRTNQAELEE